MTWGRRPPSPAFAQEEELREATMADEGVRPHNDIAHCSFRIAHSLQAFSRVTVHLLSIVHKPMMMKPAPATIFSVRGEMKR